MSTNQTIKTFSKKIRVHCHLCSLKGLCPDNIRHSQSSYRIEKNQATDQDFENLKESTVKCPLRSLIDAAFPHVLYEVWLQ